MRIVQPRLPEWYVPDAPAFLLRARDLSPEDLHTLWVLWACACEAIREGADPPAWLRSDLARLLNGLGISVSQAYRRLDRLLAKQLGGKRLLRAGLARRVSAREGGEGTGSALAWVPVPDRGPNPRRVRELAIALGEAFEADLARLRRRLGAIRADAKFASAPIPTIKEEPYKNQEEDFHETPPPPDSVHEPAGAIRADANMAPDVRANANSEGPSIRMDANSEGPAARADANNGSEAVCTDANSEARKIRSVLEAAGIFPPKAALLAEGLARRGLSAEVVREWIEQIGPELRQAARRTGGDERALLAWRLENGIGQPAPREDPEEAIPPPLRPLTEAEREAWARAQAAVRERVHPVSRPALDDLAPAGICADEAEIVLAVRVPPGRSLSARLAASGEMARALWEAFGQRVRVLLTEDSAA